MLSASQFPYSVPVEVIFRDLDAMGHVNNAVYFTYMETVRTRFFIKQLKLNAPAELPVIVAKASCTYLAAAQFGDKLQIGMAVSHIGNKSFELAYQIDTVGGRPVAAASTVLVAYDYAQEQTVPIPAKLRHILEKYLLEPKEPQDEKQD